MIGAYGNWVELYLQWKKRERSPTNDCSAAGWESMSQAKTGVNENSLEKPIQPHGSTHETNSTQYTRIYDKSFFLLAHFSYELIQNKFTVRGRWISFFSSVLLVCKIWTIDLFWLRLLSSFTLPSSVRECSRGTPKSRVWFAVYVRLMMRALCPKTTMSHSITNDFVHLQSYIVLYAYEGHTEIKWHKMRRQYLGTHALYRRPCIENQF